MAGRRPATSLCIAKDGDRISGGSGDDALTGGAGDDAIAGNSGRDTVAGGEGADDLSGGADSDRLLGQDGNDELDGQAGPDNLDGGAGTNFCILSAEDKSKACVYDRTAPTFDRMHALGDGSVDVTDAPGTVTLRVHATDDTGVTSVFLTSEAGQSPQTRLVSGTVRDGWWEGTIAVPRYFRPGTFAVQTFVADRLNRRYTERDEAIFTVVDRNPDISPPVVSELRIEPGAIDVRQKSASVTVTARITDDLSGFATQNLVFLAPDGRGGFSDPEAGGTLTRVSGTALDGRYRATVDVPQGAVGGTWNIKISVVDAIGANQRDYYGEDLYRWAVGDYQSAQHSAIAGGRLAVTGTAADASAPKLREVRVAEPTIDTLPRDASVQIDVHATDVGDGVQGVNILVEGQGLQLFSGASLISGTAHDGWWRFEVPFPQGAPPGDYIVTGISVGDFRNWSGYTLPASPALAGAQPLPADRVRTTAGAAWDGVVHVLANPAAG